MYSKEEAQQIADEMLRLRKGKTEEQIIKKGLQNVAKVLDKSPSFYLSFGPYWWLVKKLMAKYNPGDRWYQNGTYSAVDVTRFGFGDNDFLNWAVSIYYSSENDFTRPSRHILQVSDDAEDIHYTLFDEDAPNL